MDCTSRERIISRKLVIVLVYLVGYLLYWIFIYFYNLQSMGISLLGPFLHSLCCNSPWSYAVFWKLEHQHELLLVWEDGFCDIPKPSYLMNEQIEGFYLENSNMRYPSSFSSSVLDGTPGDYPVGFAVAEMSSASHVVGKGIVGKVAFTGNARWIYSDSIATDIFNSDLVPEYPNEWLLQFAAGIKTVLLLPVFPHGVLQLGSVEMVAEDEALIAYITDKFESLKKPDGYEWRYPIQQFSYMSTFIDNLEEPSTVTTETVPEGENGMNAVSIRDCNKLADHIMPMPMFPGICNTSVRQGTGALEDVPESGFSQHALDLIHVAGSSYQLSCEDYKSLIARDDNVNYIHGEDKLRASTYSDNFEERIYGNFMSELMDFHFDEVAAEPNSVHDDFDSGVFESGSNFFSFPVDYELHKALGTAGKDNAYECTYGMGVSSQDVDYCSNGNMGPQYTRNVSGVASIGSHMNEVEVEHLLETVVGTSCNSTDNNSSNNSDLTCFSMASEKHLTSSKRCHQSEHRASVEQDKFPWKFSISEFTAHGKNSASNLSTSVPSFENKISALLEKSPKRKGFDSLKVGKLSRPSSTNKRKSCVGCNQKPRPRDRQLIQDRLRELRELVPNSEKCSIDGLLDKTVKHMLFLRRVTDRADKLRHHDVKEESDGKTEQKTVEANYSHQNGTSWAIELESKQKLCPIVVKDLDHPGHMLIEMLCSDHGRFLQIADVIHCSNLTILKGMMEKGPHNSLARFVVETSGSFHRLDIFWPLMKLLQQNQPPTSGKT